MIADHIREIEAELGTAARLVAVSKYHPAAMIREAYEAGQRVFGESHVQELQRKHDELPSDIEWHFIGHLQTNKVKYIAPYISLIHAVDSARLLAEIHKQALRAGRQIPCLLQLHVAAEETKFGFSISECDAFLQSGDWKNCPNAHIVGLMCMATNTDDEGRIAADFEEANRFFRRAKTLYFPDDETFSLRSWGMSDDYPIALCHGSNLVRIGSKIFGERNY
ncbi:MAG: YggS family pyridoxal phosphate-dependent enzyme [Bacteroidaceae bacterium]|nr:YggS family pyridoxal phosphate-dependent enzyme [Bacteroidaceae bacterium]